MSEQRRIKFYWLFKALSLLVACGLPIIAICERFPVWNTEHGAGYSVGVGLVMIGIVVLIVFRRTIFNFAKEHFKLKYAPPITVWIVMLIISYSLICLTNVLKDINTILWMGLIGCAIGTVLTFVAENIFGKREDE